MLCMWCSMLPTLRVSLPYILHQHTTMRVVCLLTTTTTIHTTHHQGPSASHRKPIHTGHFPSSLTCHLDHILSWLAQSVRLFPTVFSVEFSALFVCRPFPTSH